ncbi:hypothetical protein Taro_013319 [Colocasia esculenta]|uniref:Uncharacterized protein n=1 Tax=Colocasia esculenta TaxID=4460 RepID=A0A843ULS2_COLES|nr:hypothetical protein [Colocasia esculenta]
MASRGRCGGAPAREDEQRHDERAEQQAPAPQGPVLPPPQPVEYGVFMQGLVQAMQTQAHTQAALQAQLEAQPSLRMRLVAFDHRTLDEALSAACRQEGEMEQYLEEKKASQKRPAATFQRQDKKKAVYQTHQRSLAIGSSQKQRPQDQGFPKTSAGSPARSASLSEPEIPGTSYPNHWGAVANGLKGFLSSLRERRASLLYTKPFLQPSTLSWLSLQEEKKEKKRNPRKSVRKPPLCKLKSDLLKLFLAIYHDKELAEVKEEASPTSSWSHLRPRTQREDFLGASWDCPRRASPSFKIHLEYFLEASNLPLSSM